MAEANLQYPRLGGPVGAATMAMAASLWVSSALLAIIANSTVNEVLTNYIDAGRMDVVHYKSIKRSIWLVCMAATANTFAMAIHQAYIYITVGPRRLFNRPNNSPFRWHPLVLELTICASFIIVDTTLLTGANFFWHIVRKNEGRPHVQYRTGMYAIAGFFSIFATFVTFGLHKFIVDIQAAIPEENRVGSILATVNRFPVSIVDEVDEDHVCAICLDTPATGERLRELPCRHAFHRDCIQEWLIRRPVCPLCKLDVVR